MRRQCMEFRCENVHYAKGLCGKHYRKSRNTGGHHNKPAPRHSIHMLVLEIEKSLDRREIDFYAVGLAAQEILRVCQSNLPAMPSAEKLKELRDRFIIPSLPAEEVQLVQPL